MRNITDHINPDQTGSGRKVQVIGAGLSRCATSSLQAALESPELGYFPCMHMAHVAPHAAREQIVIDALREPDKEKRQALLHKIFDGYGATTDFPGFWFIDDLMDMYPDAAVILNQRKGGGAMWRKSFEDSLAFFGSLTYYMLCFPIKTDRLHWGIHQAADWRKRWGVTDMDEFYDVYQAYVLKEAKKRGREVLIWKADDGWEPICKFLGKDVPKGKPFPRLNDAATMTTLKRILIARGILSWVVVAGSAYAAWAYSPTLARMVVRGIRKIW